MRQTAEQSQDMYVAVGDGRVFVRTWAPERDSGAAPIILLHDSLGCVELWRSFPAALTRRLQRRVIAYDRLGYGRSSERRVPPGLGFIEEEAQVHFPALRQALGVDSYVLFGHSVGGGISLTIASAAGEECLAVVSESAQAFIEERTRVGVRRAKEAFQAPRKFERLRRWHGGKARWVLNAWTETWLSPLSDGWSLQPVLPGVGCPVLAIHGDADEYGSSAFPRTICDGVSGPAELAILEGCGHVPHRERSAVVLERVAGFLARGAGDGGGAEPEGAARVG